MTNEIVEYLLSEIFFLQNDQGKYLFNRLLFVVCDHSAFSGSLRENFYFPSLPSQPQLPHLVVYPFLLDLVASDDDLLAADTTEPGVREELGVEPVAAASLAAVDLVRPLTYCSFLALFYTQTHFPLYFIFFYLLFYLRR